MKLIRYEYPTLPTSHDFNRAFNEFMGGFQRFECLARNPYDGIPTDLMEDDANVYARFELPGFKKEELGAELENHVLTITAERKATTEDEEDVTASRSISVPEGVESDKISASYEAGILTVTLPKAAERKPKQIEIK
jgi:HSP20 family protein